MYVYYFAFYPFFIRMTATETHQGILQRPPYEEKCVHARCKVKGEHIDTSLARGSDCKPRCFGHYCRERSEENTQGQLLENRTTCKLKERD